jgi:hypothetical protein
MNPNFRTLGTILGPLAMKLAREQKPNEKKCHVHTPSIPSIYAGWCACGCWFTLAKKLGEIWPLSNGNREILLRFLERNVFEKQIN